MAKTSDCAAKKIWKPSENLSARVKRLRDEYFSFYTREFRNEVRPYSSGEPWDTVWGPHQWGVVPEIYPFMSAFRDSTLAGAERIKMKPRFWREPLPVRRALFFREVIENCLPVQILEGELIVGSSFNTALSRTHTRSEAKKYDRGIEEWIKEAKELNETGVGNCGATPGHLIPNYPKVLEKGFGGVWEELRTAEEKCEPGRRKALLHAMMICCEAADRFAQRYSDEAEAESEKTADSARAAELHEIARICRKVPWLPPENFHEALQCLWFTHMLVMAAESYPGPGLSYGRIDQYLFPYYELDIREGKITRERAKELLQCFWIRHNYAYDYQGRVGTNQGINSGFGQLITLGGCGPDGADMGNALTLLMLEVVEEMNMLEPKPNVRLHKNTPDDFLLRVCEILANAQGAPFLLNFDEASMRGLKWQGLPEDKLWDYAPVGCLENTLQGNDRSGTVDVNLNLAKAVELTFNDGKDAATGKRLGPETGNPLSFGTFDEFFAAFAKQLLSLLKRIIECNNKADAIRARFEPTPYLSVLVDGCAESGRDVTEGGAEHNYLTVEGIALATVVDSLMAVKKLVYDEKRITMNDLVEALKADFEGHEKIRMTLMNRAPKYGNENPEADAMAEKVNRLWTEACFSEKAPATGKRYRGGYLSWNYWIFYGPLTAATPDGRARRTFLSNGICAVNGAATAGPTAAAISAGRIALETAPNGASHTISLSPSLVRDREHLEKLAAFLRTYIACGGTALQVNMLDADTLRDAQNNPEEYRNMLVRVTGYNAYFTMLGREIQNEIIAREAGSL